MKKKYLIFAALLIVTVITMLSGCGRSEQSLDGKNIVTFELEGGTLDYGTASTNTNIFYAYDPGAYILDPAEIPNYKMYRSGYIFTGWYTSADCAPSSLWNFKTPFETPELTLYAGWNKAIVYSYTVYYVDGSDSISLGKYEVSAGDVFEDWRKYSSGRDGYTPIAFYSDSTLTTPWDFKTTHPGGEVDTDIPVYVSYIEGEWTLVDNYATLNSALKANKNVYLTADIDLGGSEFRIDNTYSGVFSGNGYKVSNFTVSGFGTTMNPACSIFKELAEGAEIKDVSFIDVSYVFTNVNLDARSYKVAPLAVKATGVTVSNVTVSGKITTECEESVLTKLSELFYDESDTTILGTNTVNVTYESAN